MPSVTLGDATAVELIVHLYGASLGSGWGGMPGRDIVVVPGQPAVPEWALVDAEQKERAIQDPDGYLRRINAQPGVPWGRVKGLYR